MSNRKKVNGGGANKPFSFGRIKPSVGKENKGKAEKVEKLEGKRRSVGKSDKKRVVPRAGLKNITNGEKVVTAREVSLSSRGVGHISRDERDVLDFGGVTPMTFGKKAVPVQDVSRLSNGKLNEIAHNIVNNINAGGVEAYKRVASHYDILANDSNIDRKQRAFYRMVSDDFMGKASLLEKRKLAIDKELASRVKEYRPLEVRSFVGEVDSKVMERIGFLTEELVARTDEWVWNVTGYCCRSESFSEEFGGELFRSYSASPRTENRMSSHIEDGMNMVICDLAYKDLNRSNYVLIDERGKRVELRLETFPESVDMQRQWKADRVKTFLKFCGYDETDEYESEEVRAEAKRVAEERVFKLSQCMCQVMGNNYVAMVDSVHSPQRIGRSGFLIPDAGGELERYFELSKDREGNIILRCIDDVKRVNTILAYDKGTMTEVDPGKSFYKREVGIVLRRDGEWEEYPGRVEFMIGKK